MGSRFPSKNFDLALAPCAAGVASSPRTAAALPIPSLVRLQQPRPLLGPPPPRSTSPAPRAAAATQHLARSRLQSLRHRHSSSMRNLPGHSCRAALQHLFASFATQFELALARPCSSYRTNYFILVMFILGMGFLWKPVAILAAFMTGLSIAFLNDSFAVTFNEKVTRTVRQFSPHLAAKMRPPITPVLRGRPSSKRSIHICGRPRWVFVLFFSAVSCILWLTSCSLLTVLWALLIALFATVLHASFRTPNLKARLNTFREEFRAVWRNYSEL